MAGPYREHLVLCISNLPQMNASTNCSTGFLSLTINYFINLESAQLIVLSSCLLALARVCVRAGALHLCELNRVKQQPTAIQIISALLQNEIINIK